MEGQDEEENINNHKSAFCELRADKPLLAIFVIILILGITVRLIYPTEPGLWNDDMSILPTGLLWFYPHDYYPGLSAQGEPAFGNLIIGAGCMLSRQDFSNVSKITPMWYPDRPVLFGEQLTKAEDYCRMPVMAFGLIFFFLIIILALLLLDKFSALFATAFFAFYPHLLQLSRWIHVDVIGYAFIAAALIFLWKMYSALKRNRKEIVYFCLSMVFFAFAFTTKLPAALYFPFAILIVLEKYKIEVLSLLRKAFIWLGLTGLSKRISEKPAEGKPLVIILIAGCVSYVLALLPGSEFDLKNIWLTIQKYRATDVMQNSAIGGFGINTSLWKPLYNFSMSITPLDLFIFIFAVIIFIKLAMRKKEPKEKFIFYLVMLFLGALLFVLSMELLRVFTALSLGLILIMALVLSEKPYSVFSSIGLSASAKRKLFIAFIFVYAAISGFSAFSSMPYFEHQNWLLCKLAGCEQRSYAHLAETQTGEYLRTLLTNNTEDTFEPLGMMHLLYYYARPEQGYLAWLFRESFKQQIGRMPTLNDKLAYFRPNNRTIRYIVVDPTYTYDDNYVNELKNRYEPSHKIILKHNIEAVWIYDLKNLTRH